MPLRHRPIGLVIAVVLIGVTAFWLLTARDKACCGDANPLPEPIGELGLMTSLPLYWPLGASMSELASGDFTEPWPRTILERRFSLRPLDTLSPIQGLSPAEPDINPLEGLRYLAVIQPRGLSPADNLALDDWVRAGGRLLIVLDPALTGDYGISFADPRHPSPSAAIPAVIERWDLAIAYEDHTGHLHAQEATPRLAQLGNGKLPLLLSGTVALGETAACQTAAEQVIARCQIGQGYITVLADAAVFEHQLSDEAEGVNSGAAIDNLLEFAFELP